MGIKYAGIIYSKWNVSCGECCGEIERYGVAHDASRQLLALGWKMRQDIWYCPECLAEMNKPKQLPIE